MLMKAATVAQVLQDLFYVFIACFILLVIVPLAGRDTQTLYIYYTAYVDAPADSRNITCIHNAVPYAVGSHLTLPSACIHRLGVKHPIHTQ